MINHVIEVGGYYRVTYEGKVTATGGNIIDVDTGERVQGFVLPDRNVKIEPVDPPEPQYEEGEVYEDAEGDRFVYQPHFAPDTWLMLRKDGISIGGPVHPLRKLVPEVSEDDEPEVNENLRAATKRTRRFV